MPDLQENNVAISYAVILGQMIRQLRERNGADQAALADHLGVSVMTVSRIESGDTVLDVPQMEKAAEFFGMDPAEFFNNSLEIKRKLEKQDYTVFQNKKEFNKNPNFAMLSVAALAAILVGIMFAKKK